MRLFIAVVPGPGAVGRIGEMVRALRAVRPGARWVKSDQAHLTLAFLGDVAAERVEGVREAMSASARDAAQFPLALGGAGAFPSWERPRVLWLGVARGAEPLKRLESALREELGRRGFVLEERAFHPHLTLGRFDPAPGAFLRPAPPSRPGVRAGLREAAPGLSELRREAERWAETAAWAPAAVRVSELDLIGSAPGPQGRVYSTLHRQRLRAS